MSYTRHHAIVATHWERDELELIRDEALDMGCDVSQIVRSTTNDYYSFMVAPDGSKEGWDESDDGDGRRDCVTASLDCAGAEWVEVEYCNSGPAAAVVRCSYGEDDAEAVTVEGMPRP